MPQFESDADTGDGWNHGAPTNRRVVLSNSCPTDIELLEDTPLATTYLVRKTMSIPERFDRATESRSERRVAQEIESRFTLRKGADYVEVETQVKNVAEDHRLRVFFPTYFENAKTYLCDTQFGVLERPIALREDNHERREPDLPMKTQMSWTAVYDAENKTGLAIVCDGSVLESGVLDRDDRPIALTLYRATRRTVGAEEPGGQLKEHKLVFCYRIVPFTGEPDRVALFHHAQELSGGIRAITLDEKDVAGWREDNSCSGGRSVRQAARGTVDTLADETSAATIMTSFRIKNGKVAVCSFDPYTNRIRQTVK